MPVIASEDFQSSAIYRQGLLEMCSECAGPLGAAARAVFRPSADIARLFDDFVD